MKLNRLKEIQEKRKGRFIPPIAFCDEMTRRRCEGKGEEGGQGEGGSVGREGRE